MKIYVTAKTNAKENRVEEIDKVHFNVTTRELPIKGKANLEIIKILAEYFNIPKRNILLVSGFSSKKKVFQVE